MCVCVHVGKCECTYMRWHKFRSQKTILGVIFSLPCTCQGLKSGLQASGLVASDFTQWAISPPPYILFLQRKKRFSLEILEPWQEQWMFSIAQPSLQPIQMSSNLYFWLRQGIPHYYYIAEFFWEEQLSPMWSKFSPWLQSRLNSQ